jgi:NitT/TauT family transport system substrate-binding protein
MQRFVAIFSFAFFSFLLAATALAAPLRLALNWKAEPQFGGFYAAQVGALFKEQKLNVQIQEGGSGTPTIQMLTAGQVEYAVVSADEIIMSHDRGATDVVAIYASYQTNPQAIMARAEKNYQTLDQLLADKDATILWQAGLPYALYLKKRKTMKAKTAPYLGGIANIQNDASVAQQCFVTSEPLTAQRAGLQVTTFLVAETGYNPYTTVLVTKASRIKSHPEEVQKMVNAVRDGWTVYLKDPLPTNNFMHTVNKSMDAETFRESAEAQKPLVQIKAEKIGVMTKARWEKLAEQLHDLKLIKTKPKAEDLYQNF